MLAKEVERRIAVFLIFTISLFSVLVLELGNLQIRQGAVFASLADGHRIRTIKITAPRGLVYDRSGRLLATNRPAYTLSLWLMKLKEQDLRHTLDRLSSLLGVDREELNRKIQSQIGRSYEPVRLLRDISPEQLTLIEENNPDLPGVIIQVEPIREYVEGNLAAHALGYVGEINEEQYARLKEKGYTPGEIIGQSGLEAAYDEYLRGQNGGKQVEVNHRGRPVRVMGTIDPIPGKNLVLTIDAKLQATAEKALEKALDELQHNPYDPHPNAKAGAAVVIDVRTGEVLALANRPTFDPNEFAAGISTKRWNELSRDPGHVFNNRAIAGTYPPGSTFKMLTAIAALEEGKTTPEEQIVDHGVYWIIPKKDWKPGGHGLVNVVKAIKESCDIYFYEMGRRLGIDTIARYAHEFGLGQKTGIDLPGEAAGLLPSTLWKKTAYQTKNPPWIREPQWLLAEDLDAGIGQGYHNYTPLQMAVYVSMIANGGTRYRPQLVKRIVDNEGEAVKQFTPEVLGQVNLSDKTLAAVRQGMREASLPGGTAAGSFWNYPISVASKTGTAEDPPRDDQAWYVGYAPFDKPEIAVAVIIEQGGHGSSAATPVAKAIFDAYFHLGKEAPPAGQPEH